MFSSLRVHCSSYTRGQLLDVARGLGYLHNMDVAHRNVQIVRYFFHLPSHALTFSKSNILVDTRGRAHIGGLGSVLLPSDAPGVDIDRFFYSAAPELAGHGRFGSIDTGTMKASDIYAFGVLAWEVSIEVVVRSQYSQNGAFLHQTFAGRVLFSEKSEIARTVSMWEGHRPTRPDHPEISNRVWRLVQECWEADPARRMSIAEVIAVLEVEVTTHEPR